METIDIKKTKSIKLEHLSDYFNKFKNLDYKITLSSSTLDNVYLIIQKTRLKKIFVYNTKTETFELRENYIDYSFYNLEPIEEFKLLLNSLINKLDPRENIENNGLVKTYLNDFILYKDIITKGNISEYVIYKDIDSKFGKFNDCHTQYFHISEKRTKIYLDLDKKEYQFDNEDSLEYSEIDLKNAFIKFCNNTISDYNTRINYNNDVIKFNNQSIQKIKEIYSEIFI